jgi:hypothetical protein
MLDGLLLIAAWYLGIGALFALIFCFAQWYIERNDHPTMRSNWVSYATAFLSFTFQWPKMAALFFL